MKRIVCLFLMLAAGSSYAESDLSITAVATPNIVHALTPLTYTLTVLNHGPQDAEGVVVTMTHPQTARPMTALSDKGNCLATAPTEITCNIEHMRAGANVNVTIKVEPREVGQIQTVSSVSENSSDPMPNNNNVTLTVDVEAAIPPHIDYPSQ